ncbi:MAG TPA: YraN family protein [Bacteroidia bacterium]|nr:YraN family protein [Bacteroidia bacterium]
MSTRDKELGKKGELLACEYLRKKGYLIHRQNYTFDRAEVDIVAEDQGMLVFVEVKTRISAFLSDPSLLVPIKKQKQVIKAADEFVKQVFPEKEGRFDILIVITNEQYTSIEHLVDAFYPMC